MSPTLLLLRVATALVLFVSTRGVAGVLLLDFDPTSLGQNSTHQPANYSVWLENTSGH